MNRAATMPLIATDATDDDRADLPSVVDNRRTITHREAEIVVLVPRGYTNEQIAASVGLSVATVKRHLSIVMLKWCCANRAHLAAKVALLLNHAKNDPQGLKR